MALMFVGIPLRCGVSALVTTHFSSSAIPGLEHFHRIRKFPHTLLQSITCPLPPTPYTLRPSKHTPDLTVRFSSPEVGVILTRCLALSWGPGGRGREWGLWDSVICFTDRPGKQLSCSGLLYVI